MSRNRGALVLTGIAVAVLGMAAVWATFGPVVAAVFRVIPGS
jgi:hypothetical protein